MEWDIKTFIEAASAIGTVGAVFVALHFGMDGTRRRIQEERTRAGLCAAGIANQLSDTLDIVSGCVASCVFRNLTVSDEYARYEASLRVRETLFQSYFEPDFLTLKELASLDNNSANRIASAFDILNVIKRQMMRIPLPAYQEGLENHAFSESLLENWASLFFNVEDLLKVALRECVQASNHAAPIPSGEEIHGVGDD